MEFLKILEGVTQNVVVRKNTEKCHYVKNVCVRSFSGPYFPAFVLNTERYGVLREVGHTPRHKMSNFLVKTQGLGMRPVAL